MSCLAPRVASRLLTFVSSPSGVSNRLLLPPSPSGISSRSISGLSCVCVPHSQHQQRLRQPQRLQHQQQQHQRDFLDVSVFFRVSSVSGFHTSVLERLQSNPRSVNYDLVPTEPRDPEKWSHRYVRYGKWRKEWRLKIPKAYPQYQEIPEGHVDRAGNPYTTECLSWKFSEGKDPVTGRRTNHKHGPGVRRFYRMVDFTRNVPAGENSPFVERVLDIIDDETSDPFIALVVNGNFKRYILASENMKAGDLIKTFNEIPKNPVQAFEGDAYPVGALSVGTTVHNIEEHPGKGGKFELEAGAYGTVLRREGDRVILSLFRRKRTYAIVHNEEISVDERCMATVGRVSNVNHHLIPIGSAPMLIKLGNRSRSGWWQRKDGRFGRQIRDPKKCKVIQDAEVPYTPVYKEPKWGEH